jgi:transposase, IS5 family
LRTRFADPDAGWGHRSSISTRKGGAYYGYKVHASVCTATDLPLAWTVEAANEPEQEQVPGLLDATLRRGFIPGAGVLDKGYDGQPMYDACESRGIRPVIALKETPAVKAGKHKPPACEHGEWTFAGADAKRGATKWRCPSGECQPASVWIKADRLHPLIPPRLGAVEGAVPAAHGG